MSALKNAAEWARGWLLDAALPLWWERGFDRVHGGFHDKLDALGEPADLPKRVRVQARQTYVFAQGAALGWAGPSAEAVQAGLAFMDRFRRPDGLYGPSVSREGVLLDGAPDLYDQAFVLFALAAAQRVFPQDAALRAKADGLLDLLLASHAHPGGGFRETDGRPGLRSNPHMHMLEALLAWAELAPESRMASVARDIVPLALAHMIDPATGAVGEYFDDRWAFRSGPDGAVREPGHQFEWAYLFGEAERVLGIAHPAAADRLYGFGARFGVQGGRALFALNADGGVIDGSSRLWAQSERLRTAAIRGEEADALDAFATLREFLDGPLPGLWRERMTVDGDWVAEPSPASSLYHIMTAFVALVETAAHAR